MTREKIPVIRHIETGEVFSFEDCDYENAVGVFMRSMCWDHHHVTWLADDYYAVTWRDSPDHWNLQNAPKRGADPEWPLPIAIEVFGYMRPQPTYLCSMTPAQYIEVVEYRPVWADGVRDRDDFDEINEWWFDDLREAIDGENYCLDYRSYVDKCSRPRREQFTAIAGPYYFEYAEGETERDREDEMREFCQSNPPL